MISPVIDEAYRIEKGGPNMQTFFKKSRKSKHLKKDERGIGIGDIWPIISIFGLIAIFLGIMIYVLHSVAYQMPNDSAAQNATLAVMTMLINFIPWLGIILLVIGAAIVIGVLMGAFGGKKRV